MLAYLVHSGVQHEISDNCFVCLWKSVSEEDEVSTSVLSSDYESVGKRNGNWRKQDNGFYIPKPNDKNCFNKYCLEKLNYDWIWDTDTVQYWKELQNVKQVWKIFARSKY